jgi:homoserine kinase
MKVSVKVPATTANIGPGFDCLGMALPLYNTVTIEETVLPGTGIEINVMSDSDSIDQLSLDQVPTDENSIVYKAVELLYNSIGQTPSELKINIQSNIPVSRGLGSSSSVIVGALIAANELLGRPADEVALLTIACEIEGHPDNITPAIVGGLVISSQEEDGSVIYSKLNWPEEWKITVCVPDFELSTEIARSVLPAEVPMKDAVFNAQRMAMFVDAVSRKDSNLMRVALQDKLHQPYRMKLVPGLDAIMDNLKHFDNVIGVVLSGAGSSVLVISERNDVDKIHEVVKETWANQNIKCTINTLSVENHGAQIISNEN